MRKKEETNLLLLGRRELCSKREQHSYFSLNLYALRFQVLMAASMKVTVFWNVAPCSLIEIDRRFRGAYCHSLPWWRQ
jgi:hypothetical protein